MSTPRISSAYIASGAAGSTLTMRTDDGEEMDFLLDDFATCLLSLSIGSVVRETVARRESGEPLRVFTARAEARR